jgi:hypothetical protein
MTATTAPPTDNLGSRVWADVPGLDSLAAARQKLKARLTALTAHEPEPVHKARHRLIDALAAGGEVPADLGRQLHEDAMSATYFGLERQALVLAIEDVNARLSHTRAAFADTALAVLDAELHTIVAKVRDLEPALGTVRTAEQAIRKGSDAAAAWATLAGYVDEYRRLRGLQVTVTADGHGDHADAAALVARAGRYANTEEHNPLREYLATGTEADPDEPPYADGPAHLRWIAGTDVLAWVPSVQTLRAAAEGMTKARNAADHERLVAKGQAGPAAEARHLKRVHRDRQFIAARQANG